MTVAASASRRFPLVPALALGSAALALLLAACQVAEKGSAEPEVVTLTPQYDRLHGKVMARRVKVPTEANLDYAAYSRNVMLADPEWRAVRLKSKVGMDDLHFGNLVEETKAILDFTPLTEAEKAKPMHWTPVLDKLMTWNFERTSALANAYGAVTTERWGDTADVNVPYQEFAAVYFHMDGNVREVWVEIEFKPWIGSDLDGIQDRDQDKFPEVLARLNPALFTPEMADFLAGDYATKALDEGQVMDWARNLASRWYPSYNTDFAEIVPGKPWPQEGASESLWKIMGKNMVQNPLFVLRGRPFEDTLWNAFEVDGMGAAKSAEAKKQEGTAVSRGLDKGLTARLEAISTRHAKELKANGGTWEAWTKKLAPFQAKVHDFATTEPLEIQGLVGRDGFLAFRRELEYLAAPDWNGPDAAHKPLPVIAALKDELAAQGIDFLFIPIPTKLDVYPEIVAEGDLGIPGGIPQPQLRKVLKDLADARVETVDLLDPFLKVKGASEPGKRALYQKQDTHWSTVGLETAAQVLVDRVKNYSWFDSLYRDRRDYKLVDTTFETLGDIQARLSHAQKAKVRPEAQLGRRVMDREGRLYNDTDSAPILILGDSYTGVFQTVGCRNAGVTAHLAAKLGGPVDLVMGWGGGPEAPRKLAKRGPEYLKNKRLVVWMMSARDLFVYPGEWAAK
jgi:hypothetical protein